MYAVIETGGKQYKVLPNDLIQVEKLDAKVGDTVQLPVILFKTSQGNLEMNPNALSQMKVYANVTHQIRGDKIRIVKFKRRKHHRKQMGHRQYYTLLKITDMGG